MLEDDFKASTKGWWAAPSPSHPPTHPPPSTKMGGDSGTSNTSTTVSCSETLTEAPLESDFG